MTMGRHICNKSKSDPTYDPKWSGVSRAPHTGRLHKNCGTETHLEAGEHYCPRCDDYVSVSETVRK